MNGLQMTQAPNVLFREIHKNAWLKKLPTLDKRNGAFPKKGERVWVVFCVHDDSEAFLELYADQKLAVAHKPDWFVSLNNCLHVSPTICAQEDEYEFVVTLSSDVVRLTAPSWEMMMEWVETIRSKLQEMRILSPRENVYSKMPEARLPLAPTRDPNSPLPPTPLGPSTRVPGIEPVHLENPDGNPIADSSGSSEPVISDTVINSVAQQIQTSVNFEINSSTAFYVTQSEPPMYTRPRHILNRAASVPDSPSAYSSSLTVSAGPRNTSNSNVTVIEVSANSAPHSSLDSRGVFNFNIMDESVHSTENDAFEITEDSVHQFPSENNTENETSVLPGPSRIFECHLHNSSITNDDNISSSSSSSSSNSSSRSRSSSSSSNSRHEGHNNAGSTGVNYSLSSSLQDVSEALSHYECVFLPAQSPSSQEVSRSTACSVPSRSRSSETNPSYAPARSIASSVPHSSQSSSVQSSSQSSCPQGSVQVASSSSNSQRRRSRSTSTSEGNPAHTASVSSDRNRGASGSTPSRAEVEKRLQPAPHPYRHHGTSFGTDSVSCGRLTLREQQVLQLRREMLHPGGVRLQLRRKDCTNSIALVDAFGAVWVAGWKQKEHPMLYNALHIGDHLVSTGGILVQNANDAQKLIRGTSSLYVEFVIRRVPCGRVFAIRRDTEGQSLGIVQEGNTAEIRDVIPGSPAARHGLVPRAPTCDGLSLTNWILTEINGRPLNLFFKDGEVRDRLNAVGRDISILVQPSDLVKQLKKQLKGIRSYKDYIVQ